ncbi:hypothetical protein PspLS_05644 [Pyricularia sp. CBS 133598]|nr:hypothetical protein PspLS_05644 [Pyricularia sp. CBS 133598]
MSTTMSDTLRCEFLFWRASRIPPGPFFGGNGTGPGPKPRRGETAVAALPPSQVTHLGSTIPIFIEVTMNWGEGSTQHIAYSARGTLAWYAARLAPSGCTRTISDHISGSRPKLAVRIACRFSFLVIFVGIKIGSGCHARRIKQIYSVKKQRGRTVEPVALRLHCHP